MQMGRVHQCVLSYTHTQIYIHAQKLGCVNSLLKMGFFYIFFILRHVHIVLQNARLAYVRNLHTPITALIR